MRVTTKFEEMTNDQLSEHLVQDDLTYGYEASEEVWSRFGTVATIESLALSLQETSVQDSKSIKVFYEHVLQHVTNYYKNVSGMKTNGAYASLTWDCLTQTATNYAIEYNKQTLQVL